MSLPRERLTALLAESALTSVELVIAPPGYGKTTLLREYAGTDAGAVFIALAEAADLESFVRAVISATVPTAVRSIGALFTGSDDDNVEERAAAWLVSRLRSFDGTLIVDDFHRASGDPRVARALVKAIAATHGRMRWIVASRETPRFPMGSWIARGWTGMPITRDDLSFTVDEAAALAASLDIDVSIKDVGSIIDDTLGWPIGVQLALGLVARKRGPRQTRMQTREALFSLLDDEVWQPLEPNLRALIAAAALIPAPAITTLVAAGFADARARLTEVFARVPFIAPIDDDAFSIHDIFREFVAARAAPDGDAGDVTMRVGTALVAAGNTADGLRLLMAAGRVEDVESALATHGFELLETGQRSTVNAAVAFLDERGLGDDGVALAIRGALAVADGSGANSSNLFKRALERNVPPSMRCEASLRLALSYANRGQLPEALAVLAPLDSDETIAPENRLEVQTTSAMIVAVAGTRERAAVNETIAALESRISSVRPSAQARLLQLLGTAAIFNSDLEMAERLSLDAIHLAIELGMDRIAAISYGTLYSLAAFADPDTTRARSFSRSQAAAAERAADTALHVYTLRAQYIMAAMDFDVTESLALETKLSSLVDARTYRDASLVRFARALQSVAAGDVTKAEATIRSMPTAALSAPERARREAFLVILLLLRGKRSAASEALERGLLSEVPNDFGGRIEMAHAFAYRGVAYWALDRPAQSRRAFEFDTTDLPQRDRILVDALKELSGLPHPLANSSAIDELCTGLGRAGFRAYAELVRRLVEVDANDVELSAAELETLREFDRFGGRAADVAKALGKSKFTVQNQIQSAIKKLGCSGRAEAIAYARQRGWLDRTHS